MFGRSLNYRTFRLGARKFSTSKINNVKVAVVGASGGIGMPLCMLLKLSEHVTEIRMYDLVKHNPGVALDLSHLNYPAKVMPYTGIGELKQCLSGCDIVVIPGGVPRKPGMTRDDLFGANASVVRDMAIAVSENCPKAFVNIITNPVNSVTPIFCEIMKKAGKLDPAKIFGISTLDLVRAATFIGRIKGVDPRTVNCPVIGGHSGVSICPIISQCKPAVEISKEQYQDLITNIQQAGTNVVKAKAGAGSAQLAMAFSGARFAHSLIRALKGEQNVVECSYVMNDIAKTKYFSTPIVLGKNGVEKDLGIGKVTAFEQGLLDKAIPAIKKNVEKGEKFVNG